MKETVITNAIMKYLKTIPQSYAAKWHGSQYGTAGMPDIVFVLRGRTYFFEVKMPTGYLSKIQKIVIGRLRDAGAVVEVVHSVREAQEVLEGSIECASRSCDESH